MRATFKLLNSYFWKTIYGPILSLVFPVILLAILGNIFRVEYVYPGIIAMSFLFIGLLSLPLTIMELKQSSLFKYIGSSPVNPVRFAIVVIAFYIFMAVLAAILIMAFTMIIFHNKALPNGKITEGILGGIFGTVKGALSFYVATAIHLIFVIIAGLLIATISKTPQQSLTLGLVILIPSIFLSGMVLSVDILGQAPALNWISRMIPFRYSTGNIVIASTPRDQIGDMFQQLSHDQLNILFPDKNIGGTEGHYYVTLPAGQYIGHTYEEYKTLIASNKNLYHATEAEWNIATGHLSSIKDFMVAKQVLGADFYHPELVADSALFDLTIGEAMRINAAESDNNIFHWTEAWAVRRIPSVDTVKDFIVNYFKTYSHGGDWSKLQPIAEQITEGKFGWLEIFMKQTNTLYFKADRVLNMMLPLVLSGGGIWYISTHFKWSNR